MNVVCITEKQKLCLQLPHMMFYPPVYYTQFRASDTTPSLEGRLSECKDDNGKIQIMGAGKKRLKKTIASLTSIANCVQHACKLIGMHCSQN